MDCEVLLAHKARKVYRAQEEILEQLVQEAPMVLKVILDYRVPLVLKVLLVLVEPLVLKVLMVTQEKMDYKVLLAHRVSKV